MQQQGGYVSVQGAGARMSPVLTCWSVPAPAGRLSAAGRLPTAGLRTATAGIRRSSTHAAATWVIALAQCAMH